MELPQGFDLKSLRVLVLVVETGGMTQAAKQLGMTQSSISQTVGNLEEAVGAPLFDRTVRPIALTATGARLYEKSRTLMASASEAFLAAREVSQNPLSTLTLGMSESFANTVGPVLVQELGDLSRYWRIWSGISRDHHDALLSHAVDLIVTPSDELDRHNGLMRHAIMTEPFVLAFPASYDGPTDELGKLTDMPFVRYSLRSSIGQQVERQLNRFRLEVPIRAEFDTATGQLSAIADGMGWSLTTPLCLMQERAILPRLRIAPLSRGGFTRTLTLIAREGQLGSVPERLAQASRRILAERFLPALLQDHPWIGEQIRWPDADQFVGETSGVERTML